jgi:cytochrome bd-type quinol oxidase subunit 2
MILGADFGAGIVELFTNKKARHKTQEIMYESIAPVWEANHMWLIIAIVILFVGFPEIYTTMSTYLHIPLVLMLVGIIARGTAFTFRHYDAVKDNWQVLYTQIFYYASLLTPFFLGLIAAATVSHSINPDAVGFLGSVCFQLAELVWSFCRFIYRSTLCLSCFYFFIKRNPWQGRVIINDQKIKTDDDLCSHHRNTGICNRLYF